MTLFIIDDSQIYERTLNIIYKFVEMFHKAPHKLETQCVKYKVMHAKTLEVYHIEATYKFMSIVYWDIWRM